LAASLQVRLLRDALSAILRITGSSAWSA